MKKFIIIIKSNLQDLEKEINQKLNEGYVLHNNIIITKKNKRDTFSGNINSSEEFCQQMIHKSIYQNNF